MKLGKSRLYSKTQKVKDLDQNTIDQMYRVFSKYYINTSFEIFKKDLLAKETVFILFDYKLNKIQGFSTITHLTVEDHTGKTVRGLFSGDTIIEQEFWGEGALGVAFLKYLFVEKLKNPFRPLYWFLISKGFKTYLLMANNFTEHWPRYETKTSGQMKSIIDGFAMQIYPGSYDSNNGVILANKYGIRDCLKQGVAEITEDMKSNNPRIEFFDGVNAGWKNGDELCCLAKMTLSMPFKYQVNAISKIIKKQFAASRGYLLGAKLSKVRR